MKMTWTVPYRTTRNTVKRGIRLIRAKGVIVIISARYDVLIITAWFKGGAIPVVQRSLFRVTQDIVGVCDLLEFGRVPALVWVKLQG